MIVVLVECKFWHSGRNRTKGEKVANHRTAVIGCERGVARPHGNSRTCECGFSDHRIRLLKSLGHAMLTRSVPSEFSALKWFPADHSLMGESVSSYDKRRLELEFQTITAGSAGR